MGVYNNIIIKAGRHTSKTFEAMLDALIISPFFALDHYEKVRDGEEQINNKYYEAEGMEAEKFLSMYRDAIITYQFNMDDDSAREMFNGIPWEDYFEQELELRGINPMADYLGN